jgi:cytochrome c peroxidase
MPLRHLTLISLVALAACGGADAPATPMTPAAPSDPGVIIVNVDPTLPAPVLPTGLLRYADATSGIPAHFTAGNVALGSVANTDNTPLANPITDAGATLGRVLFYDRRLSLNNTVSCASCHLQARGFADTAVKSLGFAGGRTHRHSMGLANARYYDRGHFFWDERAATLEAQVLAPIQDATEMGMSLDNLIVKLAFTSYYPQLFQQAFGDNQITSDRIASALAQFVRSMVSGNAKFDQAFAGNGQPNFAGTLTAQEFLGLQLFANIQGSNVNSVRCDQCHRTSAFVSDDIHNNGLDANTTADPGAGNGRFKAPSLRNIALRAPYMHDGRFKTLREVVEFYNSGVQAHPNLDQRLRGPNGQPRRLGLSAAEVDALVAFMNTLTDTRLTTDQRWANPFPR